MMLLMVVGPVLHEQAQASRVVKPVQDVTVVEPGKTIERTLSYNEEHLYQLSLKKGECARVTVEQRGIDIVVQLRGTDGRTLVEFQDEVRPRGDEHVDVVADEEGAYTLALKAARGATAFGSYGIRLTDRRAATDDDRAIQAARRLRTSAARFQDQGKLEDARTTLERAIAITERVFGRDDVQFAAVTAQLAGVYLLVPDNTQAEALLQRALGIMDRTLGSDHPAPALLRARLALVYERRGQQFRAESLVRQSLRVIEKSLGPDHPWVVRCLVTLGTLRNEAGDLDEAEAADRRALTIMDRIGENSTATYAGLMNNLAGVYYQKQYYGGAEELFRRSLAVSEKLRGAESLPVARTLSNLGLVASGRKDYTTAEAYFARALSIHERLEGPDHPDVATDLNNLALLRRATGDDGRALETLLRALRIWETEKGEPYQPGALLTVSSIVQTYEAVGDVTNAIRFQGRADAIIERQLALNLAAGSEKQKLAFVKSIAQHTDRTISLHLVNAPTNLDASALAALAILQRKGRVQDFLTDTFAAVRQRVTEAADRALLDQLKSTSTQLARIALSSDEESGTTERQRAIADVEARKDHLEAALSERSAAFRTEMQPVTLDAVQSAIPNDAALVEFAVFRPFNPRVRLEGAAYGAPHYAAYVVRRHGPPTGRDLGPLEKINEAIEGLRVALRDPGRQDVKNRARAVDAQVIQPLSTLLGGATRLLISPDGALNLVPFEAFVDEHGRYLIEQYAMSYLTSGRDLLRLQVPRAPHTEPVIVANPLFGEPHEDVRLTTERMAPSRELRGSVTTGDELSAMYFSPLTITAEEGRAIKALFPEATLLTGARATKTALEALDAPRVLHIASHGFFLSDAAAGAAPSVSPVRRIASSTNVAVENPLLRSGLALAGANLTNALNDDGILTAMEASGLNLWGTKLVTLSACDTGVGQVRNGEGVYGLRRAFLLAGAETLVMSLWPVSDYMTREMMVPFYTGLRAGLGRGDALRQAKLAMLKRKNREHPFFWAGFIQAGEWANLDGQR